MQTSPQTARKSKARTLTADSGLPYPCTGNKFHSEDPRCWLYWWLKEQAEVEALDAVYRKATAPVLVFALSSARSRARIAANDSLKYLVDAGGLLFAWAGTTALDLGGAA